jgi:hypothetical protein
MKKILFSVFAGGLILVGCSKDGGGGSASIVGTWDVNSIITTSYLDGNLQGSDTTTEGSLQFESNGNFTSTDEDGDTSNGVYTYSNGNLSVISDGDTTNVHVTNLTQTNLHFTEDESVELSGHTLRLTADADFTRQ